MNGCLYSRLWAYFRAENNLMRHCSSKTKWCLETILRANTVSRFKMISMSCRDFSHFYALENEISCYKLIGCFKNLGKIKATFH